MRRKLRARFGSILLTMAMLLSLLPVTAMAGDEESNSDVITNFGEFLEKVEAAEYNYDGHGVTVRWSPSSACTDNRANHECLFEDGSEKHRPDGNNPQRVQEPNAQYQIFDGQKDVSISHVNFVFVPDDYTLCMNSGWKGTTTADRTRNAELQLLNSGNITFSNCTFDQVIVGSYLDGNDTSAGTTTKFDTCIFKNAYDAYAVKDVYSTNLIVNNCEFEKCGGGIHLTGSLDKGKVTITTNKFTDIDTYAANDKIGTRGLIQFADAGDYSHAQITISDNSSTGDAAVLRQLNKTLSRTEITQIIENGQNSFSGTELFTPNSELPQAQFNGNNYSTLEEAITAANGDTSNNAVTVTIIESGDYAPFTITRDKVTVQAAPGVTATFNVSVSKTVNVNGENVTLKGLKFVSEDGTAIISSGDCDNLTLDGCSFTGNNAVGSTALYIHQPNITIKDCTFKDFERGYYTCGDNHAAEKMEFTDNIFTNVRVPIDGYWGMPADINTSITIIGNTIDPGKWGTAYIQLWDYAQYLKWLKGDGLESDRQGSAINATIKDNTYNGNVVIYATHFNWFFNSDLAMDQPAQDRVKYRVLVELDGADSATVTNANGTPITAFNEETTSSKRGNKQVIYAISEGDYIFNIKPTGSTEGLVTQKVKVKPTTANDSGSTTNTVSVTSGTVNVAKINDTSYTSLTEALNHATDNDTITLLSNVVLTEKGLPGAAISRKTLTIDGDGHTLSFAYTPGNNYLNAVFGNNSNPLYDNTKLTVKNLTIENTGTVGSGYGAMVAYDANGTEITYEKCTFKNMFSAAYVNAVRLDPDNGVKLNIKGCNYINTSRAYAVDETSTNAYRNAVKADLTGSSGYEVAYDVVEGYVYLNDQVQGTNLSVAFEAAQSGKTIFLSPGTYEVTTLTLNNKSDITIEGSGMGKTILKDTDGGYLLNLNSGDCTEITAKNLTLDGNDQSSVLIKVGTGADCSGLNIENVEFKNATHGINIASADTDAGSAPISITGSSFHDLTYAGIYAERGDISVANSSFEDIRSADGTAAGILFATGVNSDPYSLSVTESEFKNITGTNADDKATGAVSVTGSGTLESFALTDNTFEGNTYDLHLGKVNSTPSIESMTMENNGDIKVYIPKENAQIYTATFVSEGVVLETKIADSTGKVTVPAAPIRTGYKFLGWNDGTATYNAGVSVTISKDTTFIAQWQQIPSTPDTPSYGGSSAPSGDYIVSVDRVSGGKVTVNPGRADKGDEVTVTVKPNDGYELDELVVTDSKGNELKLSYEGNGKYTFTMPSGTVDVKATFVKADAGSVLDDFTDVNPDAWYAQAVEFVVEEGLMTGTSATTFAPDTSMSRAMIWTVLAAYNSYNTSGGNPWYAPGQQWAMVNGVSDGTAPNGSITREQLAVMLWRAAGSPETSKSLSGYADASSVSDWAVEALAWAVDNGIISGMGGSTLAPQATATRAQVAVMLMQFVDYMEG